MTDLELMTLLDGLAVVMLRKGGLKQAAKWVSYLLHKITDNRHYCSSGTGEWSNEWTRDLREMLSDDEWHTYHWRAD